jgi:alkylhydroperoxidase family enzyme
MGHVVMTSELSGVSRDEVLAIEDPARLDPTRAAVFAFARKVTRDPAAIRREDVDALRPHLTDAQIVELVLAICRYNTLNRLADAFGVPLERENVFAPVPRKGAAGAPRPP